MQAAIGLILNLDQKDEGLEKSLRTLLTAEHYHKLKEFPQIYKSVFLIFKHKNGFIEKEM